MNYDLDIESEQAVFDAFRERFTRHDASIGTNDPRGTRIYDAMCKFGYLQPDKETNRVMKEYDGMKCYKLTNKGRATLTLEEI